MISIKLKTIEDYNSYKNEFIYHEGRTIRFEYSLKALYDWEGKWKKPFLKGNLTTEELMDFYMTMSIDPIEKQFMTEDVMIKLSEYISQSNTATTFTTLEDQNSNNKFSKGKIYTAEEIYAMMIESNMPIEFETRNLNRLLTTLRIISTRNNPPKKMDKSDIYKQNAQLNAERKRQLQTKG